VDINGQVFPVNNNLANVTLTGLVADGNPVNMLITFTEDDACGFAVFDAWTAPDPCPCALELELDAVGDCDPQTDGHIVDVFIDVTNPPGTGLLNIGGTLFEVPETDGIYLASLDGFVSNGQAHSFGGYFTDLPGCSAPQDVSWTAPESCACPSDLDGDGIIGVSDTLDLLANFGCSNDNCVGDIDGDNVVGVSDILELLSLFGTGC
jgi:hypothetical protein